MGRALKRAATVCALLLILFETGFGQESNDKQVTVPPLKVGPGDLLEVTMYDNPDLSGHFRVNDKGEIVVPLLGPVPVEGKTAEEVGRILEKGYLDAEILPADTNYASVFISEYASQGITVSGAVNQPGTVPAFGVRLLQDVMTASGGVAVTASSTITITHKGDEQHPVNVEYNPEALPPVIPKIQIFPGDSIVVPRAGAVYVLGNVVKPGLYVLGGRATLTVEKAMALAGNSGKAADVKHAHLVRTQPDGTKLDVVLELNQILKGKAPDLAMNDGDILYIPTSNAKLATQQAITSALSIGSSVAIYKTALQ